MKKILSIIWPAVIFLVIVIAGVLIWRNSNIGENQLAREINNQTDESQTMDEGADDINNNGNEAMVQSIKLILSEKYNRDQSLFQFIIEAATNDHVRGGVVFFNEEGEPAAGALALAAKVEDEWRIVFDGNGQIDCDLVQPYGFPESMISDCVSAELESAPPTAACVNNCGNEICEEIVCMAVGCPCAETKQSCPGDCE